MSDSPHADLAEAALSYRRALDTAAQLVGVVDAELLEVRTRHHPVLAAAAADCDARRGHLMALVDEHRGMFGGRTKSFVTHGVRYGLRQTGGKWHWPNAAALLDLVRSKLAPSVQARVIRQTQTVQVSKLTNRERAQIGVRRDPVTDAPFAAEDLTDSIGRLMYLLGRAPSPDTDSETPETTQ